MVKRVKKPRCRSMRIDADGIRSVVESTGRETLVIEQYVYGGPSRRVTIDLGSMGAEDLVAKLAVLLKARRARMESLERHLAHAVEESKR